LQLVFVFIVNAFSDETVSRKHVIIAHRWRCAYLILHLSFILDWLPTMLLLVNTVVCLITHYSLLIKDGPVIMGSRTLQSSLHRRRFLHGRGIAFSLKIDSTSMYRRHHQFNASTLCRSIDVSSPLIRLT